MSRPMDMMQVRKCCPGHSVTLVYFRDQPLAINSCWRSFTVIFLIRNLDPQITFAVLPDVSYTHTVERKIEECWNSWTYVSLATISSGSQPLKITIYKLSLMDTLDPFNLFKTHPSPLRSHFLPACRRAYVHLSYTGLPKAVLECSMLGSQLPWFQWVYFL